MKLSKKTRNALLFIGVLILIILLFVWIDVATATGDTDVNANFTQILANSAINA